MRTSTFFTARFLSAALFIVLAPFFVAPVAADGTVWVTPHIQFSSSVGVVGCKVDTNRIAYWPSSVDCNKICVQLSYEDRSVYLLKVDQSGGAYDVSYDAYAQLLTGKSATKDPITGGPVAMTYKDVDASKCASLLHTDGHKLPLLAANSMNFYAACQEQTGSWVGKNSVLLNIQDSLCQYGYDETCEVDLAKGENQPTCPHTLGLQVPLTGHHVWNIQYGTGQKVLAGVYEDASKATATSSGTALSHRAAFVHASLFWGFVSLFMSLM